jgi:hypothetical protein
MQVDVTIEVVGFVGLRKKQCHCGIRSVAQGSPAESGLLDGRLPDSAEAPNSRNPMELPPTVPKSSAGAAVAEATKQRLPLPTPRLSSPESRLCTDIKSKII